MNREEQYQLWKGTGELTPVKIAGTAGAMNPGEVFIQRWDAKGRSRRAIRSLAMTWGLAIVAVFIPLLHFILVPSLLIAGPIVAWRAYQQESVVLGGKGTCPKCGAPLWIERSKEHWPIKDLCAQCLEGMRIEKA